MSKNKLSFLFCLFVVIVVAIGCGGGASDYINGTPSENKKPVSYKVKNGQLVATGGTTETGVMLDVSSNPFSEGAVITIEENDFAGTRSSHLTNAMKTYRIYGVMESTDPLVPSYPIESVDEPVAVRLPNTITGDVEAYYFGIRASLNDDWRFIRINEAQNTSNTRMDVNMVRAAAYNQYFTIKTNQLNIEFALFALVKDSGKSLPSTIINAVKTVIKPENSKTADKGRMPVKDNYYTDNMKITVEVGGRNINSMNLSDYVLEIIYFNNSNSVDKNLAGNSASYPTPQFASGLSSGQNWSHSVIINELEGSADNIQFTVNTKGKKTDEFPQNFTVSLKNKNNQNDVLPFDYIDNVKLETSDYDAEKPAIPTDVVASADKIKKGDSVKLTWKPGKKQSESGEDENVTFSILLTKDGGEAETVAKELTENEWTSDHLELGSYTVTVVAVNDKGMTSEGTPIVFEVVDSALSTPVIEEIKSSYALGETITFNWPEVKDPLGSPVSYKVVISGDSLTENIEQVVDETTWNINSLGVGTYTVKIIASNGDASSESRAYEFSVKSGIPSAPVLNEYASVYRLGDPVLLSWKPSVDPFNKPLTYDLYVYTDTPGTPVEAGLNSTMWLSYTLATGTYSIKLVVSNGTESNETVVTNAFTIMTSSRATLAGTEGSVYATGVSAVRPEFFVELNESNHDENEFRNAVVVGGIDASEVTKELIAANKLKISFNNDLSYGQSYSISMNAINDKYDNAITPFNAQEFKVVNFPGKGTEAEPFIPAADGVYMTADTKLALISGIKAEVGSFKDMVFANGIINADGATLWSNCSVSNVNDNPVIEIPETDLWEANKTNMNVVVSFDGTIEGKTYKFATADKTYSTESGAVISVGDGSANKPYLVYTPGQFDDLRNYCNTSSNFKQLRDINLEEYIASAYSSTNSFPRIGDSSNLFKGVYDGCNHVVKKLRMEQNNGDLALFYGLGTADTVVKNLGLEDVYICAKGPWVAAFAAQSADGSLINCYATGEIRSERSTTSTQTSGTSGGLVGRMYNGSIIGCHFSGTVFGSTEYDCNDIGGIVGSVQNYSKDVTIKNCYVENSTLLGSYKIGGIVGGLNSCKILENCHVKNTIIKGIDDNPNRNYNIGAIAGYAYNSCFIDCDAEDCTIDGSSYLGGLIGYYGGGSGSDSIKNSYFKGSILSNGGSNGYNGGFIGYNNYLNVDNCHAEVLSVKGNASSIGGFMGYSSANSCKNSWVKVQEVEGPDSNIGGFIGYITGGEYSNCYAIVDSVKTTYGECIGLFAGANYGHIHNCYAEGNVTGCENVGGFAGYGGGKIENCYCIGSVTGTGTNIGGFFGNGSPEVCSNCYTACSVSGTGGMIGLLAGQLSYSGKFENSFTTQEDSGSIPLFGNVSTEASTSGSVSLPDGYDSSLGWDPEVWDLTKPLPTLL